jgi:hypothetical protein
MIGVSEPGSNITQLLAWNPVRVIATLTTRLNRPVPAIPLDLFRASVGTLCSVYFLHCFLQVDDFTAPNGLIDHELSLRLFWYTRIGLFHSALDPLVFKAVFLVSSLASLGLAAGWKVRLVAGFLYVVCVSTYRWNFLVMYVDDSIVHLLLFWMLLLPVGHTLVLSDWLRDRGNAWERWKTRLVPGGVMRCFLGNVALLYLAAGLWKWTSPMWRDGTALNAILNLPLSYVADTPLMNYPTALKAANYLALVIEPLLSLMLFLPAGHFLKWLLLAFLLAFHSGILVTLKIPYANFACVAVTLLFFRDEIMTWVLGMSRPRFGKVMFQAGWREAVAMLVFSCLVIGAVEETRILHWRSADSTGHVAGRVISTLQPDSQRGFGVPERQVPAFVDLIPYAVLWGIGIAQGYRLFDWIDDRNFTLHYRVLQKREDKLMQVMPGELFPNSARGIALQCYLNGITWAHVPASGIGELRQSLAKRFAARYCRRNPEIEEISVYARRNRVAADSADAQQEPEKLLMVFLCRDSEPQLLYFQLER